MMEKVKNFIEAHSNKLIGGAVLLIATFGIYGIVKLIKR